MNEKDAEVLRAAFKDAMRTQLANGREVKPSDLVLTVLQRAMETLRCMRDPEATWLYGQRSLWPEIARTVEERIDAYEAAMERYEAGEQPDPPRRSPAEPVEIKRMHVVFGSFPLLIVGRNRRRDYRLLCGYAGGKTLSRLGREVGLTTRQSVFDRVKTQLDAIGGHFRSLMPTPEDMNAAVARIEAARNKVVISNTGETD
jgi:hypothetical protein